MEMMEILVSEQQILSRSYQLLRVDEALPLREVYLFMMRLNLLNLLEEDSGFLKQGKVF